MSNYKVELSEATEALVPKVKLERDEQQNYLSSREEYEKNLPPEITPKLIKQLKDHNSAWTAAVAYTFSDATQAEFIADKSLQHRSLKMKTTDSVTNVTMQRKKVFRSPQDGSEITKYGYSKYATTVASVNANAGDLKKIVEYYGESSKEYLAD